MIELKRCPFCGNSENNISYIYYDNFSEFGESIQLRCDKCFAQTGNYKSTGDATNAWNTRYEGICQNCRYTNLSEYAKDESCAIRRVIRLHHFVGDDFGCNEFKEK